VVDLEAVDKKAVDWNAWRNLKLCQFFESKLWEHTEYIMAQSSKS
jgi:hypothetical protein